ncbi:response regulator transcription factor [Kutzneria kofuensis]|uniref:DNA-binding NarL/FixJ family response regulator n=1 Tax=Kutzneria kofuensis TaxID=103725 RepID=A0A7W9KD39_9PSEU|nr:response regulator transcription factor [Kutzneria kofuensis]MBB5890326.1 DNA-binding NarL/FixJ family response regulator [Kutzneria kofuensis]
MPDPEITVVLADDHPVVRSGLRALLSSAPGVRVVAEAVDGREAIQAAAAHRPSVLLVDIQMPELDGIDATRAVAAVAPGTAVLVLTMFEDDDSVFAAVRAGARGYILKGAEQDEILRAVRCVADGGVIFGPRIARRVDALLSGGPGDLPNLPFPQLTDREREVLDLIAAGLANAQISDRLQLAHETIGDHISSIFAKLQVADRAQAIVQARDAGLGR